MFAVTTAGCNQMDVPNVTDLEKGCQIVSAYQLVNGSDESSDQGYTMSVEKRMDGTAIVTTGFDANAGMRENADIQNPDHAVFKKVGERELCNPADGKTMTFSLMSIADPEKSYWLVPFSLSEEIHPIPLSSGTKMPPPPLGIVCGLCNSGRVCMINGIWCAGGCECSTARIILTGEQLDKVSAIPAGDYAILEANNVVLNGVKWSHSNSK